MSTSRRDHSSKSERKRQAQRIRRLAQALLEMPLENARRLIRDPELIEAIELALLLKHGAAKRQMMRIAKLLRAVPDECRRVESALVAIEADKRRAASEFRRIEDLRENYLDGDEPTRDLLKLTAGPQAWRELELLARQYSCTHNERERREFYRKVFRSIHKIVTERENGCPV